MREFWKFLMENKIWWITPTLVILGCLVALIVLTNDDGVAPFIYSLF